MSIALKLAIGVICVAMLLLSLLPIVRREDE